MQILFSEINLIFSNMSVFDKKYVPERIMHRDKEMNRIAKTLGGILQGDGYFANDMVLYGLKGTGKTLVSKYVINELRKKTRNFRAYYCNFSKANTEFKAVDEILISMGFRDFLDKKDSVLRGKGYNEGIRLIFDYIRNMPEKHVIFIFDEINKVKEYDSLLYAFLRTDEVYGDLNDHHVSYIYITNDFNFPENISQGTQSSFKGVNRIDFAPYDANQLRDILTERVEKGLKPGVCDPEIIHLCAAFGAQINGDARETIKILGKAAEIANVNDESKITTKHVYQAREELEIEGLRDVIKSLPVQIQAVALAVVRDTKRYNKQEKGELVTTGSVYSEYKEICRRTGFQTLTQRRITDLIGELVSIGMVEANLKYLGHHGRSREVKVITNLKQIEKSITSSLHFQQFRPETIQQEFEV